jgi:hypothetical protein
MMATKTHIPAPSISPIYSFGKSFESVLKINASDIPPKKKDELNKIIDRRNFNMVMISVNRVAKFKFNLKIITGLMSENIAAKAT